MNVKACVYKKCTVASNEKDFTLFQFPKDPIRRKLWMELGRVPKSPPSALFMCSKHFDKKFISKNPRRNILVGEAIPRAYEETNNEAVNDVDDEYPLEEIHDDCSTEETNSVYDYEEPINDYSRTVEKQGASLFQNGTRKRTLCINEQRATKKKEARTVKTTNSFDLSSVTVPNNVTIFNHATSKSLQEIVFTVDDNELTDRESSKQAEHKQQAAPYKNYRNMSQLISADTSSAAVSNSTKILKNISTKSIDNIDDMKFLIDSENISTFIFKGEEYVQMSMAYYTTEKRLLLEKIRKNEMILQAIKRNLNEFDL